MNSKTRDDIALFRYGVIAPLVTKSHDETIMSDNQFFNCASKQTYTNYNGEQIKVSSTSIARWYKAYMSEGLEGLKPQRRSDFGNTRKLDNDITEQIKYLKEQHKRIPATMIYDHLIANGTIKKSEVSLSTITRYVNTLKIKNEYPKKEFRRFEKEFCNELWYGDTCHGPYIQVNGKNTRAYIIALLDDASRMIVGFDVFFTDNFINLMSVMKSAVTKHGKPKMFSFDNGKTYRNKQSELLIARIGSILNFNQPYSSESKAKLERFFRTLRDKCLSTLNENDLKTLDTLKVKIANFIRDYNNKEHSSLKGLSPSERFFEDSKDFIYLSEEKIEKTFLLELERKVTKDNIISISKKEYEVDYKYCNQKITIRLSPDLTKVFVLNEETNELEEIKLLNKIDNSKIKRNKVQLTKEEN